MTNVHPSASVLGIVAGAAGGLPWHLVLEVVVLAAVASEELSVVFLFVDVLLSVSLVVSADNVVFLGHPLRLGTAAVTGDSL